MMGTPRASNAMLIAATILLLAGMGAGASQFRPYLEVRNPGEGAGTGHAGASLMGEFRTSTADFLWMKANSAIHSGAEFYPDDLPGSRPTGSDQDWRGLLGTVRSHVHPTMDEKNHRHGDAQQVIALVRMAALANPHFIRLYTEGGHIICARGERVDEALAFLRQGERRNPEALEIQVDIGQYLFVYKKDRAGAERHFARALELAARKKRLSEREEDAVGNAYRWRALNLRDWGRKREAARVCREGLSAIGPNALLENVLAEVE